MPCSRPRPRSRGCSPTSPTPAMCWRKRSTPRSRAARPVHIHVPVSLTHRGKKVENYHDIQFDVEQVPPDPGRVEAIAESWPTRRARTSRSLPWSASARSGAAPGRRSGASSSASRFPCSRPWTARGIVSRPPAVDRGVLRQRALQRLEGISRGQGRGRDRQRVQPARQYQLPRRPVHRQADIGVSISEVEIDKAYKADHALVAERSPRSPRSPTRWTSWSFPCRRGGRRATTSPSHLPLPAGYPKAIHPGRSPGDRPCCPPNASSLPMPAPTPPGPRIRRARRGARNFRKPGEFGPDGRARQRRPRGETGPSPTAPSSSAAAMAATRCPASS